MDELIVNLIKKLENYLDNNGTIEDIENATTDLIAQDDEYLKDEELSSIVYLLDMNGIEDLKQSDFVDALKRLRKVKSRLT